MRLLFGVAYCIAGALWAQPPAIFSGGEGEPAIRGKKASVPALHFRLVDSRSSQPVRAISAKVLYVWEWIQYPYPEHAWGAWVEAYEGFIQAPDSDGALRIAARVIEPRGWYDGRYTRFPTRRTPRFKWVEVSVKLAGCEVPTLKLNVRELAKVGQRPFALAVACDQVPAVRLEAKPQ